MLNETQICLISWPTYATTILALSTTQSLLWPKCTAELLFDAVCQQASVPKLSNTLPPSGFGVAGEDC